MGGRTFQNNFRSPACRTLPLYSPFRQFVEAREPRKLRQVDEEMRRQGDTARKGKVQSVQCIA
jgi:hypothetical protein